MLNAFRFGAPPHGGIAPGVDRIVMLLAEQENLREVVAFPMNQQAEDLLMQAPAPVSNAQLRELHIRPNLPKRPRRRTGKRIASTLDLTARQCHIEEGLITGA